MCLLALAIGQHPLYPLVIAGNRDEYHARPSAAAAPWPDHPQIVGGRDLTAGGSWMAASLGGRVAMVTNIRRPGASKGRSRGHLVREALLDHADPEHSLARLRASAADYSPYNLIFGRGQQLAFVNSDGNSIACMPAGIYGLSNATLDTLWPKVGKLREALARWCARGDCEESILFEALADTETAADPDLPDTGVGLTMERMLSAPFITGSSYGTRSSTLYTLDQQGRARLHERRFGADGVFIDRAALEWQISAPADGA
ncbi:MAG: NRDE family protein [Lysobacterales bacterium]